MKDTLRALLGRLCGPLPIITFCPNCGLQHVDAPSPGWDNPPHKSHLCHRCAHVWRPMDIETNGVSVLDTSGSKDSPPIRGQASHNRKRRQ